MYYPEDVYMVLRGRVINTTCLAVFDIFAVVVVSSIKLPRASTLNIARRAPLGNVMNPT